MMEKVKKLERIQALLREAKSVAEDINSEMLIYLISVAIDEAEYEVRREKSLPARA